MGKDFSGIFLYLLCNFLFPMSRKTWLLFSSSYTQNTRCWLTNVQQTYKKNHLTCTSTCSIQKAQSTHQLSLLRYYTIKYLGSELALTSISLSKRCFLVLSDVFKPHQVKAAPCRDMQRHIDSHKAVWSHR